MSGKLTKKNLMALILVSAMLTQSLCLASCSEGAEKESSSPTPQSSVSQESESEAEESESYVPDSLPEEDFGGAALLIASCNFYNKDLATYFTFEEMTGVPVDDELYKSRIANEDRFKAKITWTNLGDTSAMENAVKASATAKDGAYDMAIGADHGMINLGKDGIFRNLYDFDRFEFEKPWWTKNALESWTLAGKLYCASSYLSYCGLHWTRAVAVNKGWAEELNMPIPYDAVRDGTWTLDMLYTLTEDVTYDFDGNGKLNEKDKVGFTSGTQTWYCMQEAVDLPIYRHDADGTVYLDIDIDRTDKYVEIVNKLRDKSRYVASGDFGTDMFKEGNALFSYTQVGDIYDYIRISDIKYGILPTPKLDEQQENYINCCTDVPWAIISTVAGDREIFVSTMIEGMSSYNYNHVLPAYFETALKARAADAPDDAEMLQIISDTRTIGFAYGYSLEMNNIVDNIGNKGAASYYKSHQKVADKMLKKLVAKFEDMP